MALVHRREQVGADVIALSCHSCGARYAGDQLEEVLIAGELLCLDADCRAGGMIAHRQSTAEERFGAEIAYPFVPVPVALLDHRATLGIGAAELAVIVALERHRRVMGNEVYSFRGALAEQTGLSVDQVKRATARLVAAGLIERRQGGSVKRERGRGPNWYSLDPLWRRLADLECGRTPQTFAGVCTPQTDGDTAPEDLRAPEDAFAGAGDPICGAPVPREVDGGEDERLREDPIGTSAAPRPLAATRPRLRRHPVVPGL